ncbi:hypothetical protein BD779DRAFT_1467943 [Infundibulicybe gibba]|nr:hypothetical protein BD779DRAFT_1467943 [Infundibulicybe gibba]
MTTRAIRMEQTPSRNAYVKPDQFTPQWTAAGYQNPRYHRTNWYDLRWVGNVRKTGASSRPDPKTLFGHFWVFYPKKTKPKNLLESALDQAYFWAILLKNENFSYFGPKNCPKLAHIILRPDIDRRVKIDFEEAVTESAVCPLAGVGESTGRL